MVFSPVKCDAIVILRCAEFMPVRRASQSDGELSSRRKLAHNTGIVRLSLQH
jgi:hypothetical protein